MNKSEEKMEVVDNELWLRVPSYDPRSGEKLIMRITGHALSLEWYKGPEVVYATLHHSVDSLFAEIKKMVT